MSKLHLFRHIGEAQARTMNADIIGNDDVALVFFTDLAEQMYPKNTNTRAWALSNMQLFYEQEKERIQIMKKLRGESKGQTVLDMIRARKG